LKHGAFALALAFWAGSLGAGTVALQSLNGGDGAYATLSISGRQVIQGKPDTSFIYFKLPAGSSFQPGSTLYAELDYLDLGGPGHLGLQYSIPGEDYHSCRYQFGQAVGKSGALKTAIFKLSKAALHGAMGMGADLRVTRGGNLRMYLLGMRLSDAPGPAFARATAFVSPYRGPAYMGEGKVDASTILGKVVCGYQGWFRTPGDDVDTGWEHYIPDWGGEMKPAKIAIDMWPDMTEFTPAEQHAAPGFTNPDGSQATLFSSKCWRTVLRHFQWMQAWGIDGAALQRNADDLLDPDPEYLRDLSYMRSAANLTGRCYYIEYALKIPTKAADLPAIAEDWRMLNEVMHITEDPAYLHEGGKPVVGVYGFYPSQIDSPETGSAVLDIFQKGPHPAFVAGAGLWAWRTSLSPSWKDLIYRMGSYQPWNTGNAQGPAGPNTDYWAADKADLEKHGVIYQPELYPGGSDDNRSHRSSHGNHNARNKGSFFWSQFVTAAGIGAKWAFVGMFDEMDEGTEIFKVTSAPPSQAYFIGYEGLPSDCYLCFTQEGGKMMRKEIPLSRAKPDCAAQSQPSVPDALSPAWGAAAAAGRVRFSWSKAFPAQSASAQVDHYELNVDRKITQARALSLDLALAAGPHLWKVRAVNSQGVAGGWSLSQPFSAR
jgi:hypothetical protein